MRRLQPGRERRHREQQLARRLQRGRYVREHRALARGFEEVRQALAGNVIRDDYDLTRNAVAVDVARSGEPRVGERRHAVDLRTQSRLERTKLGPHAQTLAQLSCRPVERKDALTEPISEARGR